jgi:hypothetical protein
MAINGPASQLRCPACAHSAEHVAVGLRPWATFAGDVGAAKDQGRVGLDIFHERNDVQNYLDTDFYAFVISFSEQLLLTWAGSELASFPLADLGQTLSPSGLPLGLSFWPGSSGPAGPACRGGDAFLSRATGNPGSVPRSR